MPPVAYCFNPLRWMGQIISVGEILIVRPSQVDVIHAICSHHSVYPATLFLAIALVDKCFRQRVHVGRYDVFAFACLSIAGIRTSGCEISERRTCLYSSRCLFLNLHFRKISRTRFGTISPLYGIRKRVEQKYSSFQSNAQNAHFW